MRLSWRNVRCLIGHTPLTNIPSHGCSRHAAHAAFDASEAVGKNPTLPDSDALQETLKNPDVFVGNEGTHAWTTSPWEQRMLP